MTQHGPARRWHGRRGAALAATLAILVTATAVWIAGGGPPSPQPVGAGHHPLSASPSVQQSSSTPAPTASHPANAGPAVRVQPAGLRLSAGSGQRPAAPVAVVDGKPLSGKQIAAVVDRLPAWTGNSALPQPFHWPTQSIAKPPAGKSVPLPFPGTKGSNNKPDPSPTGPLRVLRMQPQGAVSIAPFASITFDQPMVPIATVGQLATADVPATITPKLAGTWQWIGTSTLRFAANAAAVQNAAADTAKVDRLPMATDFTVTVPAGTRAAGGARLAREARFTFSTPAPTVTHFQPIGSGLQLDPVFLAVFDQRVDPRAVLRGVTVSALGKSRPVRSATAAEVAADSQASRVVSTAPIGRVVAFRPVGALPVDEAVSVSFGAGTPSAEGPRTTAKPITFFGHTYGALALLKKECGYGGGCEPSAPLTLTFNNTLDAKTFRPENIRISPQIPGGATIRVDGPTIFVQGATQADTTYTVTVPATLKDVFGQQLTVPSVAEIRTGKATPRLDPFPQPITTLDPMVSEHSVTVNTLNRAEFRERVFSVSPSDWTEYQRFYAKSAQKGDQQRAQLAVPAWPVLQDRIVAVGGSKSRLVSTKLDLSAAMSGAKKTAQVVVLIEATDRESLGDNIWQNQPTMTWAQSTTLGLDAFDDGTNLRAWVTDLRTGAPQSGVTVGPVGSDGKVDPRRAVVTGADGVAALPLTPAGAGALLATRGTASALLPSAMWNNSWVKSTTTDRLLWFVTDDRQTYRPGETVSVKGWVRRQGSGVAARLTSPAGQKTVSYTALDAYGVQIGHGTAHLSQLGGFDLTLKIPPGANLGGASVQLKIDGVAGVDSNQFSHQFEVADFRTPDFEVNTHAVDSSGVDSNGGDSPGPNSNGVDSRGSSGGPYIVGNDLTVATDAGYYAGGPLADAPVDWQVRTAAATYAPPGWSGFTFGIWTPWWQVGDAGFRAGSADGANAGSPVPCCGPIAPDAQKVDKFSGRTDAAGSHYLKVNVGDLGKEFAGLPVTVTTQATVTDLNRQAISGTADLLVHPAAYYVGLTSTETFVTQGKDLVVHGIATDVDGAAAPGRTIEMRAAKLTTSWVNGVSVDAESSPQTCRVTSGTAPVTCTFRPSAAGSYRITATITDDQGRTSRSQLTRWVAGLDGSVDTSVELQQLTLVPDKKEYRPGESARLLVQSPIRSGSGLLTMLHNGIVSTVRFPVADGSAVVSVPITEAEIPGITASIEVVGTAPRAVTGTGDAAGSPAPRPAYATGEIGLSVSTMARTLKVSAVPRQKTVTPGGSTAIDVTVTDQAGKPMTGSEFELVVADEAVLALGGYQLPDPMQAFYPNLSNSLTAVYGRSTVMLADPPPQRPKSGGMASGAMASAPAASAASTPVASGAPVAGGSTAYSANLAQQKSSASAASSAAGASPIAERKNFDALALFVPSATTDSHGKATVAVPLPDSLTRYRVMLVAVAGNDRFGSAEATITAALPLTARPSAPRFLNFGDTLELPVLLQNQTDTPLTTDVVLQAANLKITGSAGQQVTVPANGRVEVRFPVAAGQAGTAKLRIAAVSGTAADSASVELPVYTPTTTETFATYGVLGGGQTLLQKVTAPKGVVGQFGGLQISTSSTALQQLTDAVSYLADYGYDSSDAFAGQIIAIGSLGDVLKAFSAPGSPSAAALKALVAADVTKLVALQNDDGGFPYWRHGDPSDPFNSIQSTQALLIAARQGLAVSKDSLARAEQYLNDIRSHIPTDAGQATRDTLRAYALNVRMQSGHRDSAAARALVVERGSGLPLDAVAWLLPVVSDVGTLATLEHLVGNAVVDDAGSATFTNKVTDDAWTTLQSDRRTDGLILDALISVQPKSDLIPKIVSGLMAGQTSGRWANVQENAFILLALRHYYDVFEGTSVDFVAGVWLGDRFAGQHAFTGHTTERATVSVPTGVLTAADNSDVTLRNDGTGRLYYRLGLQMAPADLKLTPLDRGFVVSRTYQAVDHPADVTRDAAGVWHVKAGARVRVGLEMVSRSAQSHVALIDPLPAGLQILNPELTTTPKDLDPKTDQSIGAALPATWYPTWYDHQNLRDDRAEAFAGYLQGGVFQYSYLAKATTQGSFVAPPPRAEQIYAPETFGRGGSDRVVIGS